MDRWAAYRPAGSAIRAPPSAAAESSGGSASRSCSSDASGSPRTSTLGPEGPSWEAYQLPAARIARSFLSLGDSPASRRVKVSRCDSLQKTWNRRDASSTSARSRLCTDTLLWRTSSSTV
eukprot:scaffold5209_cov106-Isochrysis_galbana.AAC.4